MTPRHEDKEPMSWLRLGLSIVIIWLILYGITKAPEWCCG